MRNFGIITNSNGALIRKKYILMSRWYKDIFSGKSGYGFYIWHDENGHYVEDITIGSPADRAGLRAGDRIIEINNGELI